MEANKIKDIFKNKFVKYTILIIIGVFLGWIIFGRGESIPHAHDGELEATKGAEEKTVWTCAMHPQIKQDKPGKCPICGMDLTPMRSNSSSNEAIDESAIQLSPEAMALAKVETSIVSRKNPVKSFSMYGTIKADERLSQTQTAHIGGRIEKLFVNFTGERVTKGQTIATLYSPELLSAQQELLEAKKLSNIQPMLLEAAREKLRLWKLTDKQIEEIESSGQVKRQIDIKSNTTGIITEKRINQGDYINQGTPLFTVANLKQVWAMFDAFEVDLPFLKVGNKIEFTLQAIPNKVFKGEISFIDPIINKTSRTAKVRVVTQNPDFLLKPEMYASATIETSLNSNGHDLVIPKSAILWTGKRSIVYVKQPNIESSAFIMREVVLGPSLGNAYIVNEGLADGEEIVTNGTFVIDASAQLEGKASMMNNDGQAGAVQGHAHHGANNSHNAHNAHSNHGDGDGHANHTANTELVTMQVNGACEMCQDRIQKAALSVGGVVSAKWNLQSKELVLNLKDKKVDIKSIARKIAEVGHDNEYYKAEDSVYNTLPGCCQYRK